MWRNGKGIWLAFLVGVLILASQSAAYGYEPCPECCYEDVTVDIEELSVDLEYTGVLLDGRPEFYGEFHIAGCEIVAWIYGYYGWYLELYLLCPVGDCGFLYTNASTSMTPPHTGWILIDTYGDCEPPPTLSISGGEECEGDVTPPTDPTVWSPTHTVDVWSTDSFVVVEWSGATDDLSGVDGYSILWDTSPGSVPDQTIDVPHGSDPHGTIEVLPDGDNHWFHLRTVDVAGNWTSTVHLGPFKIDTMPPTILGCPGDIDVDAAPGAQDAQVWWTEPTATDDLSGVASFTSTHMPGERFPLGITLVTYVAIDEAGNVSTCSFLIIVRETFDLVAPVATGQYLDRIEPDPYDPVLGELPVYAVYEVGELIEGCCMVINWMGVPLEVSDVTMGLYSVEIGEDFDVRDLLDSQLLPCDPATRTYCFVVGTDELEPGYYDIRLGLPFHDHQFLRVEVVAP
jgi:hypothetical protein